ncbi:MAG: hypothetical protein DRP08_07805 [Candidatus Aenigmatarchaeota archaeon]|nr:MAG: hypothetical protein DRP08_07805 [Candidatus Aenigmarchaeota archaeon]
MDNRERLKLLIKANKRDNLKFLLIEKCHRDMFYFFNTFLYTYDPRLLKFKACPFVLYPYQLDFLKDLEESYQSKKPLLVEKTRDMGFSWVFLGWILSHMLFERGFSAGIGSRKMGLVDERGSMKSLIERVRFMLRKLPKWLRGGYIEKEHTKIGQLIIPSTEAILTGEGGDNIGRGDRSSIYFLDEWAHIPRSAIVHEAVSQTSDCIIYGSTPNGKGNEFARLKFNTKIKVHTMHWSKHPKKDQKWYDKQAETMTPEQIAQELDISYNKSTKGRVYKWFDAQKHANEIINYDPRYPVYASFDWGIGDPTACLIIQYYSSTIHIIDYFETADTDIHKIFNLFLLPIISKYTHYNSTRTLSFTDLEGYYGDPDANNRSLQTGETLADCIYNDYHVKIRFKYPNLTGPRILSVRKMGNADRIRVSKNLLHVQDCLENYKFPEKEHGENEKPLHDWTSHICTALEYYIIFEHPIVKSKQQSQPVTSSRFR